MSASPLRRLTTVTAAAAALAVAVPSPALAGDLFFSKSSGIQVTTTWLEIGELPEAANAPGNAHFGDLYVEDLGNGRARVFGTVFDVECDEGTTPYLPAGGHGEPAPADGPCQLLGTRFVEGGQVTFTVDKKLTTARLTGTLAVGSGHGDTTGSPAVDITWTGVGDTYSDRQSGTFVDEYGTWTYRYDFTGRDAVVTPRSSRIGPMVFDDEAGEYSESLLGRYRSSDRQRS